MRKSILKGHTKMVVIKIAHQNQANKPIHLLSNGKIECGNFAYKGKLRVQFKENYEHILQHSTVEPKNDFLDVSNFKYWDVTRVLLEYSPLKFNGLVSVAEIEKLSKESIIRQLIESMREEFIQSLGRTWKRNFRKATREHTFYPNQAWQIL
jgi:hypothetical protein